MRTRSHSRVPALLATLALAVGGTTGMARAVPTPDPRPAADEPVYLVVLDEKPRPGAAERQLAAQARLIQGIGSPTVIYRFTSALNGFAAVLSREQVKALRSQPAVAFVEQSTKHRLDSVDSSSLLGVEAAAARAGGPGSAGRDTVVGVVDSGIWPENPSFAALPDPQGGALGRFGGACEAGDEWEDSDCNNKVVSARHYVQAFGVSEVAASEALSPRDRSGHGSHMAAVAAGNQGVRVRVDGQNLGGTAGIAPAARIAVYKACWTAPDPADDGCATPDVVAGVDQAVADGVDVISYGASDPTGEDSAALELAFLNATAAGTFVAASAGNRGPGPGAVSHNSPWVTTVGASTLDGRQGAVETGDGETHVGAMVSDRAVPRAGLVLAGRAAAPTSTTEDARLCRPGSLDAAAVQDNIVVCDRGRVARVDKSAAVAQAGGVGMVLANVRPDSVDSDLHAVPTVHVDAAAGEAIRRYVRDHAHPHASIDPSGSQSDPVPHLAPFSSRGPGAVEGDSLVKPDVTAPGVGVLAAVAPSAYDGHLWDFASGTSVSTAYVAGLAALVMGERRHWTPAIVRSAISTTADDLAGESGPRSGGAGQVDAAEVLDPGLALDAAPGTFRAWLDGRTDTTRLNLPSIAVGDLTGGSRVVRRFTGVSRSPESYAVRVQGLDGLDVTARPSVLTVRPRQTERLVVSFETGTAALESPVRGFVVLAGARHTVRIPVLVTPRTVSVPEQANGSGPSGSLSFRGVAGFDGDLGLTMSGLAGARPSGLTLEPGRFARATPTTDADTARFPVEVPSGAAALRAELDARDGDDLDLFLYRGDELVASATSSAADEVLTVPVPEPGDYELYVSSTVAANGSTTTAQLYTWVLADQAVGNLSMSDGVPVASGQPFEVNLGWRGLDPTLRWFGMLGYDGSDQRTFLTVN